MPRADGSCDLAEYAASGGVATRSVVVPCGTLRRVEDALLLVNDTGSISVPLASFEPRLSSTIDAADRATLERTGSGVVARFGDQIRPLPAGIRSPRLLRKSPGVIAIQELSSGERIVRLNPDGEVVELFASPGARVDSFDIEPAEREIVFSAGLESYDIGIAPIDGSGYKWVPADPGHEHSVSWAPRGNKITWFIDSQLGTVMRTLHVPTGYQLSVPFTLSRVRAHAWEPKAERVFVIADSSTDSPTIISVRYGGEDRQRLTAPAVRSQTDADILPGQDPPVIVYPPAGIAYGRTYPARVIVTPGGVAGWSSAIPVASNGGTSGVIRVTNESSLKNASLLEVLRSLSWLDPGRIELVTVTEGGSSSAAPLVLLD